MNTRLIPLIILTLSLLLLNGCGGSGSGGSLDPIADKPPSFGGSTKPDTWDEKPPAIPTNPNTDDIVVSVEASPSMIAGWKEHVFDMLTPAKAYAFRGLSLVEARSVSVVQLSRFPSVKLTPTIDITHTTKRNADGTYGINFVSRSVPTSRMDLMVRVLLSNGETLWAPIIRSGSTLKVNVVSTFVVETFFAALTTSNLSLSNLLPCSSDLGCPNQHEARATLWQGLVANAQSFDTTIPANTNLTDTKVFLSHQADFMNFVTTGVNLIVNQGFVGAISKPLDTLELSKADSNSFNSVFFSMGIANDKPNNDIPGAAITNRTAAVAGKTADDGTEVSTFPAISELEFVTTISTRALFGDIPNVRRSLTLETGSGNVLNANQGAEINSFSSDPSSSFAGVDGTTKYGQTPLQVITGRDSNNVIGWLTNPLFSSFSSNSTRDYLLAAPVSTGRSYALNQLADSSFQRTSVLEEIADFNYMIHLKAMPNGGFDAVATTDQKTYGVVSLRQEIAANASQLHAMTVATKQWATNSGIINETQPSTGLLNHFSTISTSRNSAFESSGITTNQDNSQTYSLSDAFVNVYDVVNKQLVDEAVGRIALEKAGQIMQEGAVSPDGKLIATYLSNTSIASRGFNQGIELTGVTPDLADSEYFFQGHIFTTNTSDDELSSLTGSSITIDDSQTATLTLKQQYKRINLSTQTVSELENKQALETQPNASIVQSSQQIQMTFTDIFGNDLILKGFVSADGNLMAFVARLGNGIGIIYAFRKQNFPIS